jgi:signal transduction histidine kinase
LANIFRPFYRVADARDRQSGGIGLGLSISQRAVELHGGKVTASNAQGGGLLVKILLPIKQKQL